MHLDRPISEGGRDDDNNAMCTMGVRIIGNGGNEYRLSQSLTWLGTLGGIPPVHHARG